MRPRPDQRLHYLPVLLLQSRRCSSCSTSQVLPFVRVDSLGAISSKERATPRGTSAAFLAYLDPQGPPEQTAPLGPTAASAFQAAMGETAGKERKARRGLQVTHADAPHGSLLPPSPLRAHPLLAAFANGDCPLDPSSASPSFTRQFSAPRRLASGAAFLPRVPT